MAFTVHISAGSYGTVSTTSVSGGAYCHITRSGNTLKITRTDTSEVITVTATPNSGTSQYAYSFSSGDPNSDRTWGSGDIYYTANFTRTTRSYTLTVNTTTGGTVSGSGTYTYGTWVTIYAYPSAAYNFSYGTPDHSTSASHNVQVTSNLTYTAYFSAKPTYNYALNLNANGGSPNFQKTATTGETSKSFDLTDTPTRTGYNFLGGATTKQLADQGVVNVSSPYTLSSSNPTATIYAVWEVMYTLTTNISPAGAGTISISPSKTYYTTGEYVTLTATANRGYRFTSWSGESTQASSSIVIEVTNHNITITANFYALSANYVTLASRWSGGGSSGPSDVSFSISLDGNNGESVSSKTVYYGETVYINVSRTDMLVFDGGYRNDILVSNNLTYSFLASELGTTTYYYVARFSPAVYSIELKGNGGTFEDLSGNIVSSYSYTRTYYTSPNTYYAPRATRSGYLFHGWNFDSSGELETVHNGDTVPSPGHSTEYSQILYAVGTLPVYINCSIKPSYARSGCKIYGTGAGGTDEEGVAQDVTLRATSSERFRFEGGYENNVKVSSDNPYIFDSNTDRNFEAKFKIKLNTKVSPDNSGSILLNPYEDGYYNDNTEVQLTANPYTGYIFRQGGITRTLANGETIYQTVTANPTTITIDSEINVIAYFTPTEGTSYVYLTSNDLNHCTLVPGATNLVNEGEPFTFSVEPSQGYRLIRGSNGVTTTSQTITVPNDDITFEATIGPVELNKIDLSDGIEHNIYYVFIYNEVYPGSGIYGYNNVRNSPLVDPSNTGYCCWYAYGRTSELAGKDLHNDDPAGGDAYQWFGGSCLNPEVGGRDGYIDPGNHIGEPLNIQPGDILCGSVNTQTDSRPIGHVEVVESVNGNVFTVSTARLGYPYFGYKNYSSLTVGSTFSYGSQTLYLQGVIHNPYVYSGGTTMSTIMVESIPDGYQTLVNGKSSDTVISGTQITLTTDNDFNQWGDGSTTTPRYYQASSGTELLVAYYEDYDPETTVKIKVNIIGSGTVTGDGLYHVGDTVTLTATPDTGYEFIRWNTGETTSTITFTASANEVYTAYFSQPGTSSVDDGSGHDSNLNTIYGLGSEITLNSLSFDIGVYTNDYSGTYNYIRPAMTLIITDENDNETTYTCTESTDTLGTPEITPGTVIKDIKLSLTNNYSQNSISVNNIQVEYYGLNASYGDVKVTRYFNGSEGTEGVEENI